MTATSRYSFACDAASNDNTVMFLDPEAMAYRKVRPVSFNRRVTMQDGRLMLDGKDASGWTCCIEPRRYQCEPVTQE